MTTVWLQLDLYLDNKTKNVISQQTIWYNQINMKLKLDGFDKKRWLFEHLHYLEGILGRQRMRTGSQGCVLGELHPDQVLFQLAGGEHLVKHEATQVWDGAVVVVVGLQVHVGHVPCGGPSHWCQVGWCQIQ